MVEQEIEKSLEEQKPSNRNRQRDHKEILAVRPKSFRSNDCMVFISKRKGSICMLIVCLILKIANVGIHEIESSVVVQYTPFAGLDIVEGEKDIIHGLAIKPIMELVQIDIIENPEVIEHGRDNSSCRWNRDEDLEVIDEL